ncbi:protein kinase [Paenarthrobacter sp. NPDC089675]|uniref:serine/threonine-protein kinase n=1 Tax=Paenarthrobacter sp. NPDC089675 TaxID=3364376 RepID=UPI0037FF3B63
MGNKDEAVDFRGPGTKGGVIDDRYRLGPVLGRGAMSTVYRATDLKLGREVAVKLFLPGSGDDSFRARQQTEMRLLAAFEHPGLVRAFDAGVDTRDDEERAYLVMELAEGRDLRATLAEGPLSPAETAVIGARLAGALAQVHCKGVIHRDIKPANILVSEEPGSGRSVKLADFGVALVMSDDRLTATGFTVGTAQYLSPEQAQGLHLTPASDIYSLGLVLLECLTGKAEYPGTPVETAAARLHRRPYIPAEVPARMASLLEAMTDMDPEQRPKAADVEAALNSPRRKLAAGRTAILPPVPSRSPRISSGRRSARTAVAAPAKPASLAKPASPVRLASSGKRRKVLGGVAAAAAGIPVAIALFLHGGSLEGTSAEPTKPAETSVSVNDHRPSVPADPVEAVPAEVVPAAEVATAPDPVQQPVPVSLPAQPAPAQNAPASTRNAVKGPGQDKPASKGDGKNPKGSENGKGNRGD